MTKPVYDVIAKYILAPALFVLVLYSAQSVHLRWAAGMLLTFPALNGTGLFIASPKSIALTPPMIPMIAVNGLLCLLYIVAIQQGGRFHGRWTLSFALFCIGLVLWLLAFSVDIEIPRERQPTFVLVYLVISLGITSLLWANRGNRTESLESKSLRQFLCSWKAWLPRAFIFTVLLTIFAIVSFMGANSVAGRLGAAPILPLFGLHSIATGNNSASKLATMKVPVFLGPVIAMSFVVLFSSAVFQSGLITGLILLLVGWMICLACIFVLAWGFDAFDRRVRVHA